MSSEIAGVAATTRNGVRQGGLGEGSDRATTIQLGAFTSSVSTRSTAIRWSHPSADGSCRVPGCWLGSSDERGDEGVKQGFAALARVVHELEEAEIKRQFVLRDASVRAQPRT